MIYKIMIGKKYVYKECTILKCNVDKVVCLKNEGIVGEGKWVAYDIDSGLMIVKAKTKKALIEKVNELKEKIETIRSTDYYQKQIKIKEGMNT